MPREARSRQKDQRGAGLPDSQNQERVRPGSTQLPSQSLLSFGSGALLSSTTDRPRPLCASSVARPPYRSTRSASSFQLCPPSFASPKRNATHHITHLASAPRISTTLDLESGPVRCAALGPTRNAIAFPTDRLNGRHAHTRPRDDASTRSGRRAYGDRSRPYWTSQERRQGSSVHRPGSVSLDGESAHLPSSPVLRILGAASPARYSTCV